MIKSEFQVTFVNMYLVMRLAVALPILFLFLWAQRYWFLRFWRAAARIESSVLRLLIRGLAISAFGFVAVVLIVAFSASPRRVVWRFSGVIGVVGFWITTAFLSWVVISLLSGLEVISRRARRLLAPAPTAASPLRAPRDDVRLDRRRFVEAATALAGAIPFGAGAYGFLIGRHRYRVDKIELPISRLPRELDGLRIAQLSDIHIGTYMAPADVRRAVGMANELKPDLCVFTGDFITGPNDPLETCISELASLKAPLGVWGCNGNHEIYADAQEKAAQLFAERGMKLLRQENAEIHWRGGKFNLIGVDYQVARTPRGLRLAMLAHTGALVRRDMPNILLSHNPNSFPRAAELGIELMLAGHTHGGQLRVEILDHRFSPAQFFTPYVAGLYKRPLGCASALDDQEAWGAAPSSGPAALVYVNRGLGTIGAPIRLGVPPEISLLTLRCA